MPDRQCATSGPPNVPATLHGFPLFVPFWQMSLRKAPFWLAVWPVQNVPAAFDKLAVPVVSGFRSIAMFPMNCAHWPAAQVPVMEPVQHASGAPAPVQAEFVQFEVVEHTLLLKSPR